MSGEPPFRVGLTATTSLAPPQPWRERFAAHGVLTLAQILTPDLLEMLMQRTASATFVDEVPLHIGNRQIEKPPQVGQILSLALHARPLLDWLEVVTGCSPLRGVTGQLAQHSPDGTDALNWHDDMNDPARKLAIVVNLSDRPFQGGQFQLRRKGEEAPLLTFDHVQPGSALLFAVRPDLEHRVTPVTGDVPRRVFAGWFLDSPPAGGVSAASSAQT